MMLGATVAEWAEPEVSMRKASVREAMATLFSLRAAQEQRVRSAIALSEMRCGRLVFIIFCFVFEFFH